MRDYLSGAGTADVAWDENVLPEPVPARLGSELGENDEREDYLRASLSRSDDAGNIATPFSKQDSSMFATIARSEALIIRPPFRTSRKIRRNRRNHFSRRQPVQHLIVMILTANENLTRTCARVYDLFHICWALNGEVAC